ncbi:MAG: acyl-[acyl-carrier-protein] thioesterase [Saprospirales bacterium]|nr:acyl-[acyl-carrier-protein] thioesterase [Saprospirales bacterium]MBK8490758.1 acyl-[acyl-carrier-protein] thioesterase [Saprospirales bacterium]
MEHIGLYPFIVQPYQVDFQQKITLMGLGHYLLESAGIHADHREFGLRDLMKTGKAWFLTRLAIQMDVYPLQYEKIWVETWVKDVGEVFSSRNFHVLNEKKEVIGGASSSWAMIDLATRKPVFLKEYLSDEHVVHGKTSLVAQPEKVPPLQLEIAERRNYQVVYSDLDIMRHVNSIRYIQWMMDLYPLSLFEEKRLARIDINYMAETVFGEEVEFRKEAREEGREYLVEIGTASGAGPVCRGRMRWA